ncbi:hypothetical protein LEAN103870_14860 [Legionella anisa]|uniref:Uncharacterized protein n=1 Tax=Legionella anisa TaxID=28082 RepID=A0AAX0WWZ0_9GAMM|nr:hypothetical protein [Legionella anisa]AWN73505.1 hypothetical protein DLD14_06415 [Legionella anisa]KTC70810.1 hypothetical protein Lani_2357 [Legionella anisa]MBN5935351.1 hypothetical protein [Legionella anisa]MCW8426380.1 hypothetical protein [Legionella anisa]MCW8448040.1 hypothetical protein [Legionella anisa]
MPKSKVHQAVEHFYKNVKNLDYKYGYEQEHLAGRAAFLLEAELRALLAKDLENPNSSAHDAQQELINDAVKIVTQYECLMKVAPGTVNELKALINYFIGKKIFDVEDSIFSESYKTIEEDSSKKDVARNFKQYKDELVAIKTSVEVDTNEEVAGKKNFVVS